MKVLINWVITSKLMLMLMHHVGIGGCNNGNALNVG